jgi:hypothetical protein
MQISDFDYSLPDELIARYPAAERRASRLLEVGPRLADRHFAELPALLGTGDLLVFNDTRVIPARLAAVKDTGGRAEILIERIESERCALAQVRASKSPKKGGRLRLASGDEVVVAGRDAEFFLLDFPGPVLTILEAIGEVPLPPYIDRVAEPEDAERYQTVYAKDPGAVAAPTAGLHFDRQMLDETLASGVNRGESPPYGTRAGERGMLRGRPGNPCSRRQGNRGWHDGRTRAGVRVCERRDHALPGRDRPLYPAGLRVPERGRDDYEFSLAPIIAAHAGGGVRRSRAYIARLRTCGAVEVSVLQLRRFDVCDTRGG